MHLPNLCAYVHMLLKETRRRSFFVEAKERTEIFLFAFKFCKFSSPDGSVPSPEVCVDSGREISGSGADLRRC